MAPPPSDLTPEDAAVIQPISDFDGARSAPHPEDRLKEVRKRGLSFRERLLAVPPVPYYQAVSLIRVPYPTKYGLKDATTALSPFMHILNRMFVIQFRSEGGLKTLLASPSDFIANGETPFFKRLSQSFGPFESLGSRLIAPPINTVPDALKHLGIAPEDVDYISFDHLHTQDVRGWLGTGDTPGFFPRAKLLVMDAEWQSAQALLPPQRDWYCPRGIEGIPPGRVIRLKGTTILGEGVALVHTPGHTEGNHSFAVHVPGGRVLVTSENGIAADAYAPTCSRIAGVKAYAEATGAEVILNGNTLERGLDQYISMVLEKTIAGPNPNAPGFFDVLPSSELSPYWLFPGIAPTYQFGEVAFGRYRRPGSPEEGQ